MRIGQLIGMVLGITIGLYICGKGGPRYIAFHNKLQARIARMRGQK